MSLFDIKKYPDRVLMQHCRPIETVTARETTVLDDMVRAMHRYRGIGLAAPQVGILKRLIVADIGKGVVKLVNPEILGSKGADRMIEGCLSLPGVEVEVERPFEITVRGLDENNNEVEFNTSGLLAKVIQHEIDHLNGKLIIEYLNFEHKREH